MQKTNILVLEDDIQLSDTIKQFLEYAGYMVYPAYDASQAKDILYEKSIDLMLLDVKVPHQNGFDMGCDDYIRKPFALKELLVRVESLIKRHFSFS